MSQAYGRKRPGGNTGRQRQTGRRGPDFLAIVIIIINTSVVRVIAVSVAIAVRTVIKVTLGIVVMMVIVVKVTIVVIAVIAG